MCTAHSFDTAEGIAEDVGPDGGLHNSTACKKFGERPDTDLTSPSTILISRLIYLVEPRWCALTMVCECRVRSSIV